MLRLTHAQTVLGPILVDDIDDGLPNKTAHRLGSESDPKAYARDGYANAPKQKCYVPRTKPTDVTIPGYIDLYETQRVLHSAGKGKIFGLNRAGLISVQQFLETDLAAPAITTAILTVGVDLTITGTKFLSLPPDISSVVITGTGAITLTQAQIVAGTGTISNTTIVIPVALIPGVAAATSFVKVLADNNLSNQVAVA